MKSISILIFVLHLFTISYSQDNANVKPQYYKPDTLLNSIESLPSKPLLTIDDMYKEEIKPLPCLKGLSWGMTISDLKKIKKVKKHSDDSYYEENVIINKENVLIYYSFNSNKLSAIVLLYTKDHQITDPYFKDFKRIENQLIEKYGYVETVYNWSNSTFQEYDYMHGLALSQGMLEITTTRNFKEGYIIHKLFGEDMKITHTIIYRNSELINQYPNKSDNDL